MTFITVSNYFLTLAIVAGFLLWGVSTANGTVKQLVLAFLNGRFEDGTPFKTSYTGFIVLDFPLSLLIAFFFYGTNGSDSGYQHFLIDAYSTLQSAFVWLYLESERVENKPFAVMNPIIWALLWQGFGAAISLPLYFRHHLEWLGSQPSALSLIPAVSAQSVPFSFAIGAVLPAIVGMLPAWTQRDSLSHQNILALWQIDPVYVALIQVAMVRSISYLSADTKYGKVSSYRWTQLSYLLAAASSAVGHIYVMISILLSKDADLSFGRMYVPSLLSGPTGARGKLASGPWLFLQYDLIIIALSSLSWAYVLLTRLSLAEKPSQQLTIIMLGAGTLTLGPGSTVSLALWWRQRLLHGEALQTQLGAKSILQS